jgi:hypothetical protein
VAAHLHRELRQHTASGAKKTDDKRSARAAKKKKLGAVFSRLECVCVCTCVRPKLSQPHASFGLECGDGKKFCKLAATDRPTDRPTTSVANLRASEFLRAEKFRRTSSSCRTRFAGSRVATTVPRKNIGDNRRRAAAAAAAADVVAESPGF